MEEKDLIIFSKEELIKKLKDAQIEIKRLSLLLKLQNRQDIKNSDVLDNNENSNIFLKYFSGNPNHYAEMKISTKTSKRWWQVKCANMWDHFLCGKPRLKCDQCENKKYEPLTLKVLNDHFQGKNFIGIYPMLENNLTKLLAFDFDEKKNKNYKTEVSFLLKTLKNFNIDYLLEISQSGTGLHVWIFFDKPIKAFEARKLGSFLLTQTMDIYPDLSFASYDRMFPSQDYIAKNGIGNLIALPLNGQKLSENKTIFVNDSFEVIHDYYQWLNSKKFIKYNDVLQIISELDDFSELGEFNKTIHKNISELNVEDFKDDITIIFSNEIYFSLGDISKKARRFLKRLASFVNKQYYINERKHISNYQVPRIYSLFKEDIENQSLILPRGCYDQIKLILNTLKINYKIKEKLNPGKSISVEFNGRLKNWQIHATEQLLAKNYGVLIAPTGHGKTLVAISLIAQIKVNTLIIVDRIELAEQWYNSLNKFLKFKPIGINSYIRIISSKNLEYSGVIDICTIQLLYSNVDLRNKIKNLYGMVICDEVHHASSYTYQTVLREFNAKYIYGQTATIERSDKLEKIIELIIGPVLYEQEIINEDKFKKILIPRFTRFTSNFVNNVPAMINELIVDSDRNSMIVDDIRQEYIDNKHILVLTDRLSHIQKLHTQITSFCKDYLILHGQLSEKERTENFAKLKSYGNNPFIILATGKFIGEGFDDERLDTLFITSPFKWIGTLSQYVGRLHREVNKIKELKVYDYVDIRNYTFRRMYNVRQSGYNALGYVASSVKSNHNTVFIYNTKNYENLLKQDLLNAKICIHLFINEYSKQKISELIKYIKTDVSILLNSKYESFAISITKLTDSEIPNLIVIDKRIVWYGGINPFSYQNIEETILKIEDPVTANEILQDFENKAVTQSTLFDT